MVFPPIPPFIIYIYKFNFGLSIWDKSVALLGTYWGTHWELDGNTLLTARKRNHFPHPGPKTRARSHFNWVIKKKI
jgi:hypothetical protein